MKFDNILKYVLLLCVASGLYAQNFYTYKLFDDRFQAVFPGNPEVISLPKAYIDATVDKGLAYAKYKNMTKKQKNRFVDELKNNTKAYQYVDNANQIAYTSTYGPSYTVSYTKREKNEIQRSIKEAMRADGRKILSFSSKASSRKDSYIAIFTTSFTQGGQKVYASSKQIYYKKYMYKWTVMYTDRNDKQIFDKYQDSVKVLR